MKIGHCKLCLNKKTLRRSHVIPNAIFKRLFRENQGKAIIFSDEESSWLEYSSDSWWEPLLCEECESLINRSYEQYALAALRNSLRSVVVQRVGEGIVFSSIDTVRIQLFIVSMMWRAAVSTLPVYSKVYLPPVWEKEIRDCLLKQKKLRSSLVSIRMSRLSDGTPNGFSLESLKSLIVSPLFRDHGRNFSFCFVVEGFFLEVFVPGLKVQERNRLGVLKANQQSLFVKYLDIFDVPELVKLMVSGYGNYVEGRSRIGR